MTEFAHTIWWIIASGSTILFLSSLLESMIILESFSLGRIPHIFATEYQISSTVTVVATIALFMALLMFFLYPQQLNVLYEARTFVVWLYCVVINFIMLLGYSFPRMHDMRAMVAKPHQLHGQHPQNLYAAGHAAFAGILLTQGFIMFVSVFGIFDQIPLEFLAVFLLLTTILSGVITPILARIHTITKIGI